MRRLAGTCVTAAVFFALGTAAVWPGRWRPPAGPNARCPACLTPCHVPGAESMTLHQQAAIKFCCPACGGVDVALQYRLLWYTDVWGNPGPGAAGPRNPEEARRLKDYREKWVPRWARDPGPPPGP
jgi:hypothetical protein